MTHPILKRLAFADGYEALLDEQETGTRVPNPYDPIDEGDLHDEWRRGYSKAAMDQD
jgi:hypothetical protein